jgi:Glycosyltransferase sugar-binding region containing DXD motif
MAGEVVKDELLAAARAMDREDWAEARSLLRALPLGRCAPSLRLIAIALWERLLVHTRNSALPTDGWDKISAAIEKIKAAAEDVAHVWPACESIGTLEVQIGAADTAAIVAVAIWERVLEFDAAMFGLVFELFFRGGGGHCLDAWEQFLTERRDYVPSYWDFMLLTKSLSKDGHSDFAATAAVSPRSTGRGDLAPLFAVYLLQTRQAPVAEIVAAARALPAPVHRNRVADYMLEMGYMPEELPVIAAHYPELAGDSETAATDVKFLQVRVANAEGRWRDVLALTDLNDLHPRHLRAANLLRAHALARLGRTDEAVPLLDAVASDKKAGPFQRSRAAFIRVTAERVKRGLPALDELPAKTFPGLPGRPLAQSLWVGRKLRWIERLAIKSYLDNGWRFQLYVYDDPENVPDGCEVVDAAAIVPAKDVFREGLGSGPHAGSIGAFSDLFRYALLAKRGGLWTDTDVINFKKFDPDGRKFICTEINDAGVVTLNGALMAAPAGDTFVERAYARAQALLSKKEDMFFTRIGPFLLAELLVEQDVDAVELMPTGFLSAISWMSAGMLLQPYAKLMARSDIRQAANLHVYTEIWRTLGLGLERPPSPETFLGRLYAEHFREESADLREVASA